MQGHAGGRKNKQARKDSRWRKRLCGRRTSSLKTCKDGAGAFTKRSCARMLGGCPLADCQGV
eukprot:11856152-Prorocentrum_lima.AAC.1